MLKNFNYLLILFPSISYAYVGPALAMSSIIFLFIIFIVLAVLFFLFVYKPIRKLLRTKK